MSRALPGENYCAAHQGNHSHYAEHNCALCRMIAQRNDLAKAVREMLLAYESLLPGLRYIAVQDYALINEAPLLARKALAKVQP